MRVSRTRFSKRRVKRKTEFPIVALIQKKRKSPWVKPQSLNIFRKETGSAALLKESAPENKTTGKEASGALNEARSSNRKTGGLSPSPKGLSAGQSSVLHSPQKKSRATIDYKNVILLRNLITAEGKILPRRINKLTAKQQRYVQKAIKSARIMGLIPFINKSRPF